jgi:hypothetical protein
MYAPNNSKHRFNSQSQTKRFPWSVTRWRKFSRHRVSPKSIIDWLQRNREAIFNHTLRSMVYSTIFFSVVHIYTSSWEIFGFMTEYVFPIFSELM